MSDSTSSIVKTLTNIINKSIDTKTPLTTNVILLYKVGSNLTATNLNQVTY